MTAAHHPFPSQVSHVPLADQLIHASELLVRCRAARFRESFGLTDIHYRLLVQVGQHGPVALGTLARLLNRDDAQISRMVKMLNRRGLIANAPRPATRPLGIRLTGMGQAACNAMTRIARESEAAIAAGLREDHEQGALAVERLCHAARAVLDGLTAEGTDAAAGEGTCANQRRAG